MKALVALLLGLLGAGAASAQTVPRSATLADLFPAEEAHALSKTLPGNPEVRFRWREPVGQGARGVLVFIPASDSGEMPPHWAAALDQRQIIWIAPDGFGNSRPTAQRVLAALMALRLARAAERVDTSRLYVAGISGGGRVASQCITRFPALFAGAMYQVGADDTLPQAANLRAQFASRRFVFITGSRDFNRREMKYAHRRYVDAGVAQALLIDARGFGHEPATSSQWAEALDFLEKR